ALLIGLLLPALAGAREAGRSTMCLSNLRQSGLCCRQYADESRGRSPALGVPYADIPNWALVVQTYSGSEVTSSADLYSTRSALICPTIAAFYGTGMQRTYAINVTGHAGAPAQASPPAPADPDNYDAAPVFLKMDQVVFPSATP